MPVRKQVLAAISLTGLLATGAVLANENGGGSGGLGIGGERFSKMARQFIEMTKPMPPMPVLIMEPKERKKNIALLIRGDALSVRKAQHRRPVQHRLNGIIRAPNRAVFLLVDGVSMSLTAFQRRFGRVMSVGSDEVAFMNKQKGHVVRVRIGGHFK